jgi:hypothetical protein
MTPRATSLSEATLRQYLDAETIERAAHEAARWIKTLRALRIDGRPLRDRFTYRGDSLWWFAELYVHKQAVIERVWRTALSLDAFCAQEQPAALEVHRSDALLELLAPQAARRLGIRCLITEHASSRDAVASSRLALDLKSRFYTWSAFAARMRPGDGRDRSTRTGGTLAFVHSAFWRAGQEGYIGAVLQALQARAEAQPVRLIGVGPSTNFKARRWWHPIVPSAAGAGEIPVEPIERFASWRALAGSRPVWRDRFDTERALLASDAIRAHSTILAYDIWPIVAGELRGIARLQFPWSARAMDEAAAALEATRPRLVVTYAEAGGWGRALMLEARRRDIPSVGLQHGFIYRHWLNYLHEPDEMQPSPNNAADRGFPRPDLTLVYDGYAANQLTTAGHFPRDTVRVTGSPALDALVENVARVNEAARRQIREQLATSSAARTAAPTATRSATRPAAPAHTTASQPGSPSRSAALGWEHLIVLVTKFTQVRDVLPALFQAVSTLDDVWFVIKPHPAETADPYRAAARAAAAPNVVIAPPTLDLAHLLAVARLLVTVNSTVAIDAIALGLPALIVQLPNNLTPFVEAGIMADGSNTANLSSTIETLIHDEAHRAALLTRARAFAAQHAMQPDGRAAERAADALLGLLQPPHPPSRPASPQSEPT